MSHFALRFNTDNAEFAEGELRAAVDRVLHRVGADVVSHDRARTHAIQDVNGNAIGYWRVHESGQRD